MRKPFFKKSHQCWYVKIDGREVRLDPDEENAHTIWQQMRMAASSLAHPQVSFSRLADAWLAEHKLQLTPVKYGLMQSYLSRFCAEVGDKNACDLTKLLVMTYLQKKKLHHTGRTVAKVWSLATQRDVAAVIKSVLNWAVGNGYLAKNPIFGLKLKQAKSRQRTITHAEHAMMLTKVRSQKEGGAEFALYLIASHCGARPQQIREVTAKNVSQDGSCWFFADHKTAEKTGRPLIVYLSPCLQTITKMLVKQHPKGPLFRNGDGDPWLKDTVARRMKRLREALGLDGVVAYSYRHTFATEALLARVPIATVSALLGHVDTRMVSKVYGHLDQHSQYLVDAAREVSQKRLQG